MLGAWLYTLLSGRGAAIVIGTTLIATVPLRRILKSRGHHLGEKGFALAAAGWGLLVGGTSGSGVVLLSLLLAAGLESTAVIATDAAISIATGVVKITVFAIAGVLTPTVIVDCAVDGARRISVHVSRQADRRAAAGPCAHRDPRRHRDRRRRGDDLGALR